MRIANIHEEDFIDYSAPDRLQLWTKFINRTQPVSMAEIGVWKGEFARDILGACPSISTYYMVDPWAKLPDWNKPFNIEQERFDKVYAEAMNNTASAGNRRVVLRGRTREVVSQIPDGSLDFAYIDGDHSLRGVTIDLQLMLPKIKPGGYLAGDDFWPTPWQHDSAYEPTLVCPYAIYFAESMNIPIRALPHGQFIIQCGSGSGYSFSDPLGAYRDLSLNRLPPKTKRKGLWRGLFNQ